MDAVSRERKKRDLRRRLVVPGQSYSNLPERPEEGEGQKASRHWGILAVAVMLLLALSLFLGWSYYQRNHRFTSYETSWEVSFNEGSLVGYGNLGNYILKYSRDGASCIDRRGKTAWTESYEMKSPILSINGEYAAIADQRGNAVRIYNVDGKQGEAATALPISRVTVSAAGLAAVVMEDSASSYITFFRRDGSPLDITVKTKMSGDGYPLDLSLSEDGTQLMCSFVYIRGGQMKNRVVFYDFSEVGKNVPNRLVGGFDEPFEGTMAPRVACLEKPYSCAFSGKGLVFFSSENLASPKITASVSVEGESIESIFYSKKYVGMIVDDTEDEEYQYRLEVYRADGSPVLSRGLTDEYKRVEIDDDLIILYNDNSCRIYNTAGVEKLYAEFDFPISKIRKGRLPNTMLVTGTQLMREIKLK